MMIGNRDGKWSYGINIQDLGSILNLGMDEVSLNFDGNGGN